ncbi:MAG: hypothetical protein ABUS79_10360 [Pseudomonadota bacterium]
MSLVEPTDIARIAYEARRGYARALGEPGLPDWEEAPPQLRQEILLGVEAVLCGAASTGARLHDLLTRRIPDPPSNLFKVDYQDLPIEQRRKLLLLRATVLALIDGPCTGLCHDEKCQLIEDHPCHLDTCLSRFGIPPAAWEPAGRPAPTPKLYS